MTNATQTAFDQIDALGWSDRRTAAAKYFVAGIVRHASPIKAPGDVDVEFSVHESGQISVTAKSRLYYSFGCCFIGPRGGIAHKHVRFDTNF